MKTNIIYQLVQEKFESDGFQGITLVNKVIEESEDYERLTFSILSNDRDEGDFYIRKVYRKER